MMDWSWIIGFFVLSLAIGLYSMRSAGKSAKEFFLSANHMPWWLLGVSLVATTFSTDTPNLVTDMVRTNGVAGNWAWWAFLLTGMLTVFVYARLWRRLGVLTDLEFYELRYGGKAGAFLRGFRAIYLGLFMNVMIMASVTLAAIKIGGVMLNISPVQTILLASAVTALYSVIGGFKGVILTDFFQFGVAMLGSVLAAIISLGHPKVGGLTALLSHPEVASKLSIFPDFNDTTLFVTVLVIPLAVQWWSVWYPGAEPGGGGYVAQRMLASKNENQAVASVFFFTVMHYALRPWPWILVALCSMVVFPDLASLTAAFPHVDPSVVRNDLAYSAMLTFLPHGLLGMVVASLIAAYMSTISTHLNWGSSYLVNDVYHRFVDRKASEKSLVRVGRISTVTLMAAAGALALFLNNALQTFNIMLQIGAGTGLLYILRWFWWRVNAAAEITAMVVSFLVAVYFQFLNGALGFAPIIEWEQLIIGVGITTAAWITAAFLGKPTDKKTLRSFYMKSHPGGPGWKQVLDQAKKEKFNLKTSKAAWQVPQGILCMALGCLSTYSALFATGYWIYGMQTPAMALTVLAAVSAYALARAWRRMA
jgi:Na+/proline symporter